MITVAADGSGDFVRIQDAIDQVTEAPGAEHVVIRIQKGIYPEKLHLARPNVSLIGESAENTIVTYGDYANKRFSNGEPYHTFHSYTALIGADDVTVEGLTFENTAGKGEDAGQALAVYADGDRVSFRHCRFLGHQDTLFTGPLPPKPRDRATFGGPRDGVPPRPVRQYYERCYIQGDVDFIFGSATAVFLQCDIVSSGSGWVTAASTPEGVPYGYVFIGCRLMGEAAAETVGLGRPWRNEAHVAFLHCWLGPHVKRGGWDRWNEREPVAAVRFVEHGSTGPGAVVGERAPWSRQLTAEQAAAYTVERVLAGRDGWHPAAGGGTQA